MSFFTLRILPALLLAVAVPVACDEEPVDVAHGEAAPVLEVAAATAPVVLARGVTDYTITREAAGARVVLRGAAGPGALVAETVAPGVVRLQLDWQGRALEFEVDANQQPAPLTIRAGERSAVVHLEGTDEPAARALFDEVRDEWELARAAFVELDLVPGLLAQVEQQIAGGDALVTDDLTLTPRPAEDGGCPNICYQNGCAWFWDQYCHTAPIGGGQCVVGVCGCGDC
ncbi:hypothetical protein [Nannocystis punicea]|uniref:Uncharacterized protein n=1 Tax=Nannocystis punicea TaxID=2995304 RepID=A0ABY7GZJ7_9BACT|nr:hypothetical protein [Nannocystis poenicansa]WAS92408.1 hypothetical protein O0S08_40025 [Nannocystis poenicansa]